MHSSHLKRAINVCLKGTALLINIFLFQVSKIIFVFRTHFSGKFSVIFLTVNFKHAALSFIVPMTLRIKYMDFSYLAAIFLDKHAVLYRYISDNSD